MYERSWMRLGLPVGVATLVLSGWLRADDPSLETIETRSGKRYRGTVEGFDARTKSYLLLVDGQRLSLPEADILTIQPPEAAAGRAAEPAQAPSKGAPAATAGNSKEAPASGPGQGAIEATTGPGSTSSSLSAVAGVTLGELTALVRSLPPPGSSGSRERFEEAVARVRSGAPLSAVEPLARALAAEPACASAAILLAGVRLWEGTDPESAYALLVAPAVSASNSPAARSLLVRAAAALGYRRVRDRAEEESIRGRFQGAEREYRLCRFFLLHRDEERARAAWREYRRADPSWERVTTPEGLAFQKGEAALERGDFTSAAREFLSLEENPFAWEEGKPLYLKALLARSDRARASGKLEIAAADLAALIDEVPERRQEFEGRLNEVQELLAKERRPAAAETQASSSTTSVAAGPTGAPRSASPTAAAERSTAPTASPAAAAPVTPLPAATASPPSTSSPAVVAPPPSTPDSPGPASGPSGTPYLVLKPGSAWTYLHGDGSREVQKLDRIEVLDDGRTAYRFSYDFQLADARIPYQKTGFFAGGFFQIVSGSRATAGELALKVPVVVGENWSWRKGDISFEREHVATDVRVICRAGSFENCLKVKATSRFDKNGIRSRPVVQWFYYAPGVGLVKIEGESAFDGRELEEYRSGGPPEGGKEPGAAQVPTAPLPTAPLASPPAQGSEVAHDAPGGPEDGPAKEPLPAPKAAGRDAAPPPAAPPANPPLRATPDPVREKEEGGPAAKAEKSAPPAAGAKLDGGLGAPPGEKK